MKWGWYVLFNSVFLILIYLYGCRLVTLTISLGTQTCTHNPASPSDISKNLYDKRREVVENCALLGYYVASNFSTARCVITQTKAVLTYGKLVTDILSRL